MYQNTILTILVITALSSCISPEYKSVMTVTGEISVEDLGLSLVHEHVLVDFAGADKALPERYNPEEAYNVIYHEMIKLREHDVRTFVDCTPRYLGRNVHLLRRISEATGIRIITNTGFYGANNNHYIPEYALSLSAEELAGLWITEFQQGIEASGIRPGFIKTGVDRGELSDFHEKLIRAAAITHKATGLVIMSHTGPATAAFQQLEVLKEESVMPDAFIWTHAQNEPDLSRHIEAARLGAWVSLDGFRGREGQLERYLEMIGNMKENNCLHRLLLSMDAGWFDPDIPDGSNYVSHTLIFETLIPELKRNNFTEEEIKQILEINPGAAFAVGTVFIPVPRNRMRRH